MMKRKTKTATRNKAKKNISLSVLLGLLGIGLFVACNSSTNNPAQPFTSSIPKTPTITSTGTIITSTPTNSPTLPAGANTFTPTPTWATPTPPAFQTNFSTSAAPRGMIVSGGILTVGENEVTVGGIVTEMEEYTGAGTMNLVLNNCCPTGSGTMPNVGNAILQGCPPQQATPASTLIPFVPVTLACNAIQGFVNPGGDGGAGAWSAVLDLSSGGSATLYCGYIGSWINPPKVVNLDHTYVPFIATGYGGIQFNNPRGLAADRTGGGGRIYVADTGNGYVDDFTPYEGICPDGAIPIHRWNGAPGVTQGGPPTNTVFKSPAVVFKSPYAVVCDTAALPNVWVGDSGYPNSYITEWTSDATTILQSWQGVPGCVVHGLAVDSATNNVLVADSGNNLVEVYTQTGTLLTEIGDPGPAAHEFVPFSPTCIAFSGGFIYVGDTGNNFIDVFQ